MIFGVPLFKSLCLLSRLFELFIKNAHGKIDGNYALFWRSLCAYGIQSTLYSQTHSPQLGWRPSPLVSARLDCPCAQPITNKCNRMNPQLAYFFDQQVEPADLRPVEEGYLERRWRCVICHPCSPSWRARCAHGQVNLRHRPCKEMPLSLENYANNEKGVILQGDICSTALCSTTTFAPTT